LLSLPGETSEITPVFDAELLSAQALIYRVPVEAKVIDLEVEAVPPPAKAAIFGVTG
jgi:hypothetical protein